MTSQQQQLDTEDNTQSSTERARGREGESERMGATQAAGGGWTTGGPGNGHDAKDWLLQCSIGRLAHVAFVIFSFLFPVRSLFLVRCPFRCVHDYRLSVSFRCCQGRWAGETSSWWLLFRRLVVRLLGLALQRPLAENERIRRAHQQKTSD